MVAFTKAENIKEMKEPSISDGTTRIRKLLVSSEFMT
jgi:hypothetical protein